MLVCLYSSLIVSIAHNTKHDTILKNKWIFLQFLLSVAGWSGHSVLFSQQPTIVVFLILLVKSLTNGNSEWALTFLTSYQRIQISDTFAPVLGVWPRSRLRTVGRRRARLRIHSWTMCREWVPVRQQTLHPKWIQVRPWQRLRRQLGWTLLRMRVPRLPRKWVHVPKWKMYIGRIKVSKRVMLNPTAVSYFEKVRFTKIVMGAR